METESKDMWVLAPFLLLTRVTFNSLCNCLHLFASLLPSFLPVQDSVKIMYCLYETLKIKPITDGAFGV